MHAVREAETAVALVKMRTVLGSNLKKVEDLSRQKKVVDLFSLSTGNHVKTIPVKGMSEFALH